MGFIFQADLGGNWAATALILADLTYFPNWEKGLQAAQCGRGRLCQLRLQILARHLKAVQLWTTHFTSLSLSFYICDIGTMPPTTGESFENNLI